MSKRDLEMSLKVDEFKELASKIPLFALARFRENEITRDHPHHDILFSVFSRVIINNVLLDACMYLETLKRRTLTRVEVEKTKRRVDIFMEGFLKDSTGG